MSEIQALRANLQTIEARIASAAERAGRRAEDVTLLLATKTVPAARVAQTLAINPYIFGENKVLEGEEKAQTLDAMDLSTPARWHLIGHLQTNKVKYALRYVDCIQSVDRFRLLERLDQRLQFEGRALDIMLQVNTSQEASKYGVPPEEVLALARRAASFDTLRIRGLMTIGKLGQSAEAARPGFRQLRECRDRLLAEGIEGCEPHELSMGMSGDLEVAVEEGATIVRVGTAVFGERAYPDAYYWPS